MPIQLIVPSITLKLQWESQLVFIVAWFKPPGTSLNFMVTITVCIFRYGNVWLSIYIFLYLHTYIYIYLIIYIYVTPPKWLTDNFRGYNYDMWLWTWCPKLTFYSGDMITSTRGWESSPQRKSDDRQWSKRVTHQRLCPTHPKHLHVFGGLYSYIMGYVGICCITQWLVGYIMLYSYMPHTSPWLVGLRWLVGTPWNPSSLPNEEFAMEHLHTISIS